MGPIGLPELIVILLIAIVIFGATRLPALGKGLGEAIKNFKGSLKDGQEEDEKKPLGSSAKEREKN